MSLRRYELLFLLHPDLSQEQIAETEKKYTDLIEQAQGRVLTLNEWGRRQLAYEIMKQNYGFYVLLDYLGQPALMTEIERQMRIDERVFRYMTVLLEVSFDEEKYQAELSRREAEEQKRKEEGASLPEKPVFFNAFEDEDESAEEDESLDDDSED